VLAAGLSDDLVVGLVLGFVLGALLGPLIRSWLSWREWQSADREADLFGDVLDHMVGAERPPLEDRPTDEDRPAEPALRSSRPREA
jgi:hypothetical protein